MCIIIHSFDTVIYSNAIASVWEARLEQESYFALLVGSWKRRLFVHRFVHEEESSRIMKVFFESKEDAVGRHYLPFRYEEGWLHDGCADEDVDLMDLSRSEPPPPSPP